MLAPLGREEDLQTGRPKMIERGGIEVKVAIGL